VVDAVSPVIARVTSIGTNHPTLKRRSRRTRAGKLRSLKVGFETADPLS
jgi:hypothetical protein